MFLHCYAYLHGTQGTVTGYLPKKAGIDHIQMLQTCDTCCLLLCSVGQTVQTPSFSQLSHRIMLRPSDNEEDTLNDIDGRKARHAEWQHASTRHTDWIFIVLTFRLLHYSEKRPALFSSTSTLNAFLLFSILWENNCIFHVRLFTRSGVPVTVGTRTINRGSMAFVP